MMNLKLKQYRLARNSLRRAAKVGATRRATAATRENCSSHKWQA